MKEILGHLKLNIDIIAKLRQAFESSPIFSKEDKYSDKYLLCCAVIERLEFAVDYINFNLKYPFDKHGYICFMLYANMIVDGVKVLYERIFQKKPYDKEIYFFKHAQEQQVLHLSKDEYIDDDKFFEYLRSITFAHPFNTDRTYKNIYGSQVSPTVLPGVKVGKFFVDDIDDPVGALVYSSKKYGFGTNTVVVETSFKQLFSYINDRYEKLIPVIEWFNDENYITLEKWKSHKTSKNLKSIEALIEMVDILKERYEDCSGLIQLLWYLKCHITYTNNEEKINAYRSAIESKIPLMQNFIDELEYEQLDSIIRSLTRAPKRLKGECYYHIEKIYRDLNENDKRESPKNDREKWALIQANEFYESFAKKWVMIDVKTMSNSEIKLLVATACYCENNKK